MSAAGSEALQLCYEHGWTEGLVVPIPRGDLRFGLVSLVCRRGEFSAQEKEVLDYFKAEGKKVYTPDLNAFRTFAQKKYLDKYGQDWPKGALERINAL